MSDASSARGARIAAFGAWVSTLQYDRIPPAVRDQTKLLLLDLIGVALAGTDTDASRAARAFATGAMAGIEGVLWGSVARSSLLGAVYSNATAANALDYEDGGGPPRAAWGHPGSLVIPAAVAAGHRQGSSGEDLIVAVVAGYEVSLAIGGARRPYPGDRWAHGWESFGPAAAVAKLLGLSSESTAQALAVAGFQGPNQPAGMATRAATLVKAACPGWAALSGAAAALGAAAGLTAPLDLLDDDRHYETASPLMDDSWQLLDVYLKPYAACRWTHPAIDAVLSILATEKLPAAEVRSIEVATFTEACLLERNHPESAVEAQYSLPYIVAAALVDGEFGPAQQQHPRLNDPRIAELADRVRLEISKEHDAAFPAETGATVTVTTEHGTYVRTVRNPLGDPTNPMDRQHVREKFERLCRPVLGRDRADELEAAVMDIDKTTVAELVVRLELSIERKSDGSAARIRGPWGRTPG